MRRFPIYPSKPCHRGTARISIERKNIYLKGPWGSDESYAHYRLLLAEWTARRAGQDPATPQLKPGLSVAMLVHAYVLHAQKTYRDRHGKPGTEVRDLKYSTAPLVRLYGSEPVADFRPSHLKAVRQAILSGSWRTEQEKAKCQKGHRVCRGTCNQRIQRLVRMFAWGVEEECVPVATWQSLLAVKPIREGRDPLALDHPDVEPVPHEIVAETLPHLGVVIREMVKVQLLTGMRPGEVCDLVAEEIDQKGVEVDGVRVWVYRPRHHKTAWHGYQRQIAIGPKAQALLAPFLAKYPEGYLFRPADVPLARNPGPCYPENTYRNSIHRICRQLRIPKWSPNQLRHTAGTDIEEILGLDVARATLGHRTAAVTKVYARADLKLAARAAATLG